MNSGRWDDFSDMDDLDTAEVRSAPSKRVETMKCTICLGRGVRTYGYVNVKSYPCGCCRGTGQVTGERIRRYEGAKKAAKTAEVNLRAKKEALRASHEAEINWLYSNQGFEFADSLRDQFESYGRLSEKQLAAVTRCIEKARARYAERKAQQEAAAPSVEGANSIMAAFRRAQSNKIRRPKMRFDGVQFSLAPDSGRNAGSIYVVVDDVYAGKITDGKFLATREGREFQSRLDPIFADPMKEAVAYGQKVGNCSCCGRELTNHASIEAGIGPICAENFFG